jgi:hypothetical protein
MHDVARRHGEGRVPGRDAQPALVIHRSGVADDFVAARQQGAYPRADRQTARGVIGRKPRIGAHGGPPAADAPVQFPQQRTDQLVAVGILHPEKDQ